MKELVAATGLPAVFLAIVAANVGRGFKMTDVNDIGYKSRF
jgi:hypothetical protein